MNVRSLVMLTILLVPFVLAAPSDLNITGSLYAYAINTTAPIYVGGSAACTAANGFCLGTGLASTSSGWLNTSNRVYLVTNSSNLSVGSNGGAPNLFVDNANAAVGVGTAAPTTGYVLAVNGSAIFANSTNHIVAIGRRPATGTSGGSILYSAASDGLYIEAVNPGTEQKPMYLNPYAGSGVAVGSTATPTSTLHLQYALNGKYIRFNDYSFSGGYIDANNSIIPSIRFLGDQSTHLQLGGGGAVLATLTTSGTMGIGTMAPVATLHINSSQGNGSFVVQNTTGSTHLFVNGSSGNVGVGTAVPLVNLHIANIASNVSGTTGLMLSSNTAFSAVGDAVSLAFANNVNTPTGAFVSILESTGQTGTAIWAFSPTQGAAKEIVRVSGSSEVGVMTATPSETLDVNGTVLVNASNTTGSFKVMNKTGSTHLLVNGNSGFVGVGTISPQAPLHVNTSNSLALYAVGLHAGSTTPIATFEDAAAYNGDPSIRINFNGKYDSDQTVTDFAAISAAKDNTDNGDFGGFFAIHTRANGGNNDERLRVTSRGDVGIGTSVPQSVLHVLGNMRVNSSLANGSLIVQNTSAGIHLFVNGNSGAVGIGTASPNQALQVVGNANITGNLSTTGNAVIYGGARVLSAQSYFCDLVNVFGNTMCNPYYNGSAIGTAGAITTGTGSVSQPGLVGISKGTGANSGYRFMTELTAFRLNGSERFTASIGAYVLPLVNNNTWSRVGFHDSPTSTAPTDGVYFEYKINSTVSSGNCIAMTNGARVNTSVANFSITTGTTVWYEFEIVVNASATGADCRIVNATDGALIWNGSLLSGIPTASGRETGSGVVIYSSGTAVAAVNFASLDYLNTEIMTRRRFLN